MYAFIPKRLKEKGKKKNKKGISILQFNFLTLLCRRDGFVRDIVFSLGTAFSEHEPEYRTAC